jgi:hypothetical protein
VLKNNTKTVFSLGIVCLDQYLLLLFDVLAPDNNQDGGAATLSTKDTYSKEQSPALSAFHCMYHKKNI